MKLSDFNKYLIVISIIRLAQPNKRSDDKGHQAAVRVNYPLHFFASASDSNWRQTAVYDSQLVAVNEKDKLWTKMSRAQDQEDNWLYENWFYGMKNGVIVESGALDGLLFSTSYMYENFANWTSVHVEADPENYRKLRHNRNGAININCGLCNEPKLLHYASSSDPAVGGFVELMPPSFLEKWHKQVYDKVIKVENLPAVQCVTMKSLLRELNLKHIDIWILDTEGAEESVLRGTDFNEVKINAIVMECDDHDQTKNKRKTDLLEANGFKCISVSRNCMCVHNTYKISSMPKQQ